MTPELDARVMREIVEPALEGMKARGAPFNGTLFAGLMIKDGAPKLIEFNARFGDPETQVVLPRLDSDLLALLAAAAKGDLHDAAVKLKPKAALTVVMAADGYPEAPQKGSPILGVSAAREAGAIVTHAGTAMEGQLLVANGGRVLNVTALGDSVKEAQSAAYAAIEKIEAPGLFFRRDIGWRATGAPPAAPKEEGGRRAELVGADAVAAALLDLDFDFGKTDEAPAA
jgi:phosphoribosylamine--glycine ligase